MMQMQGNKYIRHSGLFANLSFHPKKSGCLYICSGIISRGDYQRDFGYMVAPFFLANFQPRTFFSLMPSWFSVAPESVPPWPGVHMTTNLFANFFWIGNIMLLASHKKYLPQSNPIKIDLNGSSPLYFGTIWQRFFLLSLRESSKV